MKFTDEVLCTFEAYNLQDLSDSVKGIRLLEVYARACNWDNIYFYWNFIL